MLGLILLSLGVFLVSFLSVGEHWGGWGPLGSKIHHPREGGGSTEAHVTLTMYVGARTLKTHQFGEVLQNILLGRP